MKSKRSVRPVSAKNVAVLSYLYSHVLTEGYQPGKAEIGEHFGIGSQSVSHQFARLEKNGYIEEMSPRAISLLKLPNGEPFTGFTTLAPAVLATLAVAPKPFNGEEEEDETETTVSENVAV